jgi:predicted metal-binding protein
MLEALRPVMQANAPDVKVRAVQCLGVCKRPATIAVSAPDGYTFVFGDLEPESGAPAVAAFALSYSMGDYGFVPWAERPELLRSRLVARIPSVKWSPEDGRSPDAGK